MTDVLHNDDKYLEFEFDMERLLEHFKIRPTLITLNTIHMKLKNAVYKDIPKIKIASNNILTKQVILDYCKQINDLISNKPSISLPIEKHKNTNQVHMFTESSLLPKNVYVGEKQDDDYDVDIQSVPESEHSNSDEELVDDGGYVYDEDSEEFSD
jgi:hypothetical protein